MRETKELAIAQRVQRSEADLLAIAAVLGLAGDDPVDACRMAGLDVGELEAVELVALAKTKHRELTQGRPQALDGLLRAGITRLAATAALSPSEVSPGQRAGGAYALGRLRETLGLSDAPEFSTIILEVVGPEGERLVIGPTNAGSTCATCGHRREGQVRGPRHPSEPS